MIYATKVVSQVVRKEEESLALEKRHGRYSLPTHHNRTSRVWVLARGSRTPKSVKCVSCLKKKSTVCADKLWRVSNAFVTCKLTPGTLCKSQLCVLFQEYLHVHDFFFLVYSFLFIWLESVGLGFFFLQQLHT